MPMQWTLRDVFEIAIQAERNAAAVYEGLAEMFADYRTISEFWIRMGDDELQHAAALEEIHRELSPETLVAAPTHSVASSATSLALRPADELLEGVHNFNDACQLAHDMESSEINTLFLYLRTKLIPSEERCSLATRAIYHHQNQLTMFTRQFGGSDAKASILAKRKTPQPG